MTKAAVRVGGAVVLALTPLALLATLLHGGPVAAQGSSQAPKGSPTANSDGKSSPGSRGRFGVRVNDPKAFQGYTLFAPLDSKQTYLIDMQGRVVRSWKSDCLPGQSAYLLENGHLLRAGHVQNPAFALAPGRGGRVQEFTWEGKLVWDFTLATDKQLRHHDICKLPNGNVLLIVWEKKTTQEAAIAGCTPATSCFIDYLVEVRPTGKTTGKVVWEWHVWDHLVQNKDKSKANYGDVAAHPERVDINFDGREGMITSLLKKREELAKLQSLGYVGRPPASMKGKKIIPDCTHINSVAYNAELDQIMLSVHEYNEIWIIDHGTTTAEAAGHTGGRRGKGGDLLYRWGNPSAYGAGTAKDRQMFFQHDAQWIPRGLPGEGHALVFNNGHHRIGSNYSSVDEIVLPVDAQGQYTHKPGAAFGPDRPVWSYAGPSKVDFFARIMSGAHRLPNGNTLICSTTGGTIFEVTAQKEIVWKYAIPPAAPAKAAKWARKSGPVGSFRAYRYAPTYPGLVGRDLTPGLTVEELRAQQAKSR